ncbi:hypothetical protein BJ878DRAFT_31258 [Calycina marina]|uniref:Uncharacterized protein n=1 Tax=Calycina marina TaxID=1763456 RepID=A0A9P7Z4K1_9HELO|nr:hypothetical protein BJ878DRAFT_31258 [Calycina marina]
MALTTPLTNTTFLLSKTNTSTLPPLPPLSRPVYLMQTFLRTTTVFLFFRSYTMSLLLFRQSVYASQIVVLQSWYAASAMVQTLYTRGKEIAWAAWKVTERLRQKLFFEFMVFILGGGYAFLLVLLWPGWIVVGAGICAVCLLR